MENVGGDDEKAIFEGGFCVVGVGRVVRFRYAPEEEKCFTMRRIQVRDLSSGTSPERIAPESVTPLHS